MEMDSIHLDNMEGIEDESTEQLLSPCLSDMGDICGDPQVLPRVGDQYQVEIPPLIAEHDRLQLVNRPTDLEVKVTLPVSCSLGLPIPLMWANSEVGNINETVESRNCEESQITSNNECAKPKVLDTVLGGGKDVGGHSNPQPTAGTDKMKVDLVLPQILKIKLDQVERGFCILPGSLGESWRDIEHNAFLLGLYIFGKNLILVKRFVGSKGMGDILSFYYGKFYRSDGYRRWSERQKLRSRRCIRGQKIFTGWRQRELLSRLFSNVSEECQNMLVEVSRTFGEGKISFEDYVFTLKNTVGLNMLVEAVGIGKGKQDLTGTAMEPIKANQVFSVRPEVPMGKACSSLTSADIIKFLTGNFRLSKARSNDLFWEAVWPRLLARGWHSEQPKDHGVFSSKHSLVFLIPNVKKFSRRRLVKGNHYFDSVSDVLNKVASDPGLLELEIAATKDGGHEENRWDPPIQQDPDALSNKQHRCYLQPHNSSGNQDLLKFTIVDTSLVQGAECPKVRELRSLPIETINFSIPFSLSSESEQDTSEESKDEADETNTSNPAEDMTDRGTCADSSDCTSNILNTGVPDAMVPAIVAVENLEIRSTSQLNDKQQRKTVKYRVSQKVKSGRSKYLTPVTKRQGLIAFIGEESSCAVDREQNKDQSHCRSHSPDACEDKAFQMDPLQNLSAASSLAKGSPDGSDKGIVTENCLGREVSPEKPRPHILFDLNIPHVSPDLGTDETFITAMMQNNDNSCANMFLPSETSQQLEPLLIPEGGFNTIQQPEPFKIPEDGSNTIQQPITNNRRQSTRNRPLSTKALEAFACELFSPKRKRKSAEAPQNDSTSRSSQRVRSRTGVSTAFNNGAGNDIAGSGIEKSLDGFCSNTNMVGES